MGPMSQFWVQAMILGCLHLLVSVAVHSAIVLSASNAALLIARAEEALIVRRALAIGIGLILRAEHRGLCRLIMLLDGLIPIHRETSPFGHHLVIG